MIPKAVSEDPGFVSGCSALEKSDIQGRSTGLEVVGQVPSLPVLQFPYLSLGLS